MKQQVEQFLNAAANPVQERLSSLLGTEFTLEPGTGRVLSRGDLAGLMTGRSITSTLVISGDAEGTAGVITSAGAAIRMAGSLLMLPDAELEESIRAEEVSDEICQSFGEIAEAVAEVLSAIFAGSPECRFSRGDSLLWSAADPGEDGPLPGTSFYAVPFEMTLSGAEFGPLLVALPATPFGFDEAADSDRPSSEPAADDAGAASTTFDPEANQKLMDELFSECQQQASEEVGALLGTAVTFSGLESFLVDRDTFFASHLKGDQVFADMELVNSDGHIGSGWFAVPVRAAIRLGGVLVMLPDSELDNAEDEENFYEDLADAYGEVANIISGVFTRIFENRYRLKNRFIKKGLTVISPLKDGDKVEDMQYCCASMNLDMPEYPLGRVHMLLPAVAMQVAAAVEAAAEKAECADEVCSYPVGDELDSHRMRVDALLEECCRRSGKEMAELCGVKVELANLTSDVVSREEFLLKRLSGRQVLAHIDVTGEIEGRACLVISLVDAIYMGGVLVMLPPPELEAAVEKEEFNEDVADAWGEIANIITGAYSSNFEEQYRRQIRFIRKELEELIPTGVDLESDVPMPPGDYYLSSMDLVVDGREMGRVSFVVPLAVFELQGLVAAAKEKEETTAAGSAATGAESGAAAAADSLGSDPAARAAVDILLVGDDGSSAARMAALLEARGLGVKTLSFKDEVLDYMGDSLKAVWLVMREVNEQAFGAAIKISSRSSMPIIAAGPAWTRSKVIKAVKYGVRDILILPATDAELEENFTRHL